MEVILRQDIENLGLEFDLVNVKPGYARNYLIPQGYALLATPKNKALLEETLKKREAEQATIIKEAQDKVEQLKNLKISISAKVGSGDRLFGSINNIDLSEAIKANGLDIDKKYIKIPGNTIKRLGNYSAKVRLHRNVEYDFSFDVVADEKSSESKKHKEEVPSKTKEVETKS